MPLYTVTEFSSIHKTYGLKTIFDQVIDVFFFQLVHTLLAQYLMDNNFKKLSKLTRII